MNTQWIKWAKKLQAIAQNGLAYSKDKFDLDRFRQIQKISAEIINKHSSHSHDFIESCS